jgi:hypothetical protein
MAAGGQSGSVHGFSIYTEITAHIWAVTFY